jgi:hypothetical protein
MLEMAQERFQKDLWQSSGWGGENGLVADRRCIVGTLRWVTGVGADAAQTRRSTPTRSPWFFAYEEGVFEIVAILMEKQYIRDNYGWNSYVQEHGFSAVEEVRRYQKTHGGNENEAILAVLEYAEGMLISYNDGSDSSTSGMIKLMEKAIERIGMKRKAIAAEMDRLDAEEDRLASVNPDVTVVASREDEVAAREEYEAKHGLKWDPLLFDADGKRVPLKLKLSQQPVWNWSLQEGGWLTKLKSRIHTNA